MGFRPSLLDWHPNVNNNYGDYNENGSFISNFYHHHQHQQQYSPNVDHHLFNYNNVLQHGSNNLAAAQQNFNPTRYSLPKLTSVPTLDNACRLRQWVSPSSSINQNNSTPHLPSFVEREKRDRTISMSSSTTSGREQKVSLKKTKICEHWRRSGQCSYGELCWYAHGEFDLRKSAFTASKTDVRKKEEEKKNDNGKVAKRTSTNVKGLTVNIPMSITTMDSSNNSASMPLSPAQERWISMSLGSNSEKTSTSSAFSTSNHQDTSTSTSTVTLENLEDIEKPEESPRIDLVKQQQHQHQQKQNLYHEYPNYQHNSSYNNSMFTNRSYGRGPNHRQSVINHFNGVPQPPKMTRSNTCFSHMDNSGGYPMRNGPSTGVTLRFPPPSIPPPPSAPTAATSTISAGPPHPHIQNPMYSHLVDEIYRRQKHIESGGKLETVNMGAAPSLGPMSVPPPGGYYSNSGYDQHVRKNEALFRQMYSNMLCQQQQQQRHEEIGVHGFQQHPRRDFQAQHSERMLNRTFPYQQQSHLQQGYQHQQRVSHPDCPCSQTRQKASSPYLQPPPQAFPSFSNLFPSVHSSSRPDPPLQSPPKINESLLPNDDTFSIWFDSSKPKIGSDASSMTGAAAIESDSNSSLLSKMEMLRAESVPIGEAEIVAASSMEEKCQYDDDVSPGGVLSLYDLLSNENLLNDDKENDDPKKQMSGDNPTSPFFTNIFDFDLLNITVNSETTPTQSLYLLSEDRTPTNDTPDELMTPNPIINNNCIEENVERCYFYSSAGNCPFGDACALAHSIDTD